MAANLHQLLGDCLQQKGANVNDAPALLRDLAEILELHGRINPATLLAVEIQQHQWGLHDPSTTVALLSQSRFFI